MTCLDNLENTALQGNYFAEVFQYLRIELLPCSPKDDFIECANAEEQNLFLKTAKVQLFYINTHMLLEDYVSGESSITTHIEQDLYTSLDPEKKVEINLYV
jgi:hypothetical protein